MANVTQDLDKIWCAIRTKPNNESLAKIMLGYAGYEVFYARVLTPTSKPGARRLVPLFPGYLFIRCGRFEAGSPEVHNLPGMAGWVRVGDEIPSVPEHVIGELKSRIDMVNTAGGVWKRYQSGDRVRVKSGRLEGLGKVLESAKSPDARIRVLIDFLGRQVKAQIPWQHLTPVTETDIKKTRILRRRTRGRGRWISGTRPEVVTQVTTY